MRIITYIVMVFILPTIITAKTKPNKCKGLDGKKYGIDKGYETECNKFTCEKNKGKKRRPKMLETALGDCCTVYTGDDIPSGSEYISNCCEGFDKSDCDDDGSPTGDFNNGTETRSASGKNWMGKIPGWRKLNELSIPGTHDTMAWKGLGATIWHKTQNRDLWSQLYAGVRFVDIRLKIRDNTLGCYHGNAYLESSFSTVMYYIYSFLYWNPTETILMRYNIENSADNYRDFCPIFNRILRSYPVKLWNDDGSNTYKWQGSNYPTLGEIRGKLVPLNWNKYSSCFGFRFDNIDLDNYNGKVTHPLTGHEAADVVEWEWGRRKRRSIEEHLNKNETSEAENVKSYSINKTDTNDSAKNKENANLQGNRQAMATEQIKDSKNNTKENQTVPETEERQTRFGYEASDEYKRELEVFLDNVRRNYKDELMYTWVSAFDWKVHNERLASHVNPHMRNYMQERAYGRVGVVIFDYIDKFNSDLPGLIYERNYDPYACRMYQHCNYGGGYLEISPGVSEWSLRPWGWNDIASSFSIKPGCWLKVFEHENYQGRSGWINGDLHCVERSWNDYISSAQCIC